VVRKSLSIHEGGEITKNERYKRLGKSIWYIHNQMEKKP
jgi:hypothetical protein